MAVFTLYSLYRYTYPDGVTVEAEVLGDVKELLEGMEQDEEKREKIRKRREKSFTDLGMHPAKVGEAQKKPARAPRKNLRPYERLWEGPDPHNFTWLVGESAIWAGPEANWLVDEAGNRLGCRLCGHLAKMPQNALCLNPECQRWGLKLKCGPMMQETYGRPPEEKVKKRKRA